METMTLITGLLSIVALVLKVWIANKPKREEQDKQNEIQQNRQDIIVGNVGAVESRIDKLLQDTDTNNSNARKQSSEDVERRISEL